jgi:hypothetical protein
MTRRFEPKFGILPATQRKLWPQLAPLTPLGWVLYGGTAVAIRLGHRQSVDFDFFHEAPLDLRSLRAALPWLDRAAVLQDTVITLTVVLNGAPGAGVKLSFFGRIDFGRIGKPMVTNDGVLQAASMTDLLATKLKVILQRVEAKDYRDIAALLRARASLARGLAGARLLFGASFQPSESLKALVYFEGGDLDELDASDRQTLVAAARRIVRLPSVMPASPRLGA